MELRGGLNSSIDDVASFVVMFSLVGALSLLVFALRRAKLKEGPLIW